MSMIGEFMSEANAGRLEKILTKIAESDNPFERKSGDDPINLELIQWYLDECSNAGIAPNCGLLKKFDKKF